MSERMLITKLVRDGDKADLFGRGHQYKDLTLFDLSDLADVGVDYASLPNGEEVPCRFWAVYEMSEKLNKAGNPYKDVIALEAIDSPATATSTDTSALLSEARAIRALLQVIVEAMSLAEMPVPFVGRPPAPLPPGLELPAAAATEGPASPAAAVAQALGAELDRALGRPVKTPDTPAPVPENGSVSVSSNGHEEVDRGEPPARKPADLLKIVNARVEVAYDSVLHLGKAIEAEIGPKWRPWPAANNTIGWWDYYDAAMKHAQSKVRPETAPTPDHNLPPF